MGLFDKWRKKGEDTYSSGLSVTKERFSDRIIGLFTQSNNYDAKWFDSLMTVLIQSDVSLKTAQKIIKGLRKEIRASMTKEEALETLVQLIGRQYGEDIGPLEFKEAELNTILLVGVNGSGKTTTVAKLGKKFSTQGKKVLLVGGDTYRAAGSDQLKVWAEGLGLDFYGGHANQDPASVYVDAARYAKENHFDLMICDSAGRLHNKANLMKELEKMRRVLLRETGSILHTYLVIDGNTGQNGIEQAKVFTELAQVDSLIVTKLDGSSKGGILLSIKDELNIKVSYIGLGETAEDLRPFEIEAYLYSLFNDYGNL